MYHDYIGVTDFTAKWQVKSVLDTRERFVNSHHLIMIGVMMSHKTLNDIRSKWSSVFPKKEDVKKIFLSHRYLLNTIHYADYDGIDFRSNLYKVMRYGGPHLNAIQLDMIWPNEFDIKAFRNSYPNIRIVLQVNQKSFEECENNTKKVTEKILKYEDAVDCVLFDKSMGKGLGLDAVSLIPFIESVRKFIPHMHIAVAGGLGPASLNLIEPLRDYRSFSLDAQSKLRPTGNAMDPLDWDFVNQYIILAIQFFAS